MNDALLKVVAFAAGAAIGSVVTWKLVEKKYRDIANEEIDTMREYYKAKMDEVADRNNEQEEVMDLDEEKHYDPEEDPVEHLENIVQYKKETTNYNAAFRQEEKPEPKQEKPQTDIYVISPDEYGENEEYDRISLTYYNGDGFLCDDEGELVDDIEDTVGFECLEHFGEHVDDAVFVRNDILKADYEILLVEENYRDIYE